MKVVLRANIKTLEKFSTNNVRTCLKALEKQEEIIPKRKTVIGKIMKFKAKINFTQLQTM